MRRRDFISLLSSAAIAWPHVVKAQVAAKRPLVAVLLVTSSTTSARYLRGLPQGLQELGYVEGQNIDIVYRYAEGNMAHLPALAEELVRLKPDVLVTGTTPATFALKQATATIPIVNASMNNPEGVGFIASMARPGGR